VQALLAGGRGVVIVDVRTPAEYAKVHATGTKSVPLDQIDPVALAALRKGDEPLYVICHSGARAAKACQKLLDAGIANVLSIEGGMVAWEQAGLPVVRGAGKVISLERQVRIAAGILVLIGAVLAWTVHPAFVGLSAFIGAGLMFAGITDTCGLAMVLAKMPWNRAGGATCEATSVTTPKPAA